MSILDWGVLWLLPALAVFVWAGWRYYLIEVEQRRTDREFEALVRSLR